MESRWTLRWLCAGFGACAFSLPLGRLFAFAALVTALTTAVRTRRRPPVPAVAWFALAFVALAVVVTVWGPNPAVGVGKLDKLAWFCVLLPAAWVLRDGDAARAALRAFAFGAGVLSLMVVFGNTTAAWMAVRAAAAAGQSADFVWELTDRGGMTDGQMLMVGILVCVGFIASPGDSRRRAWWALLALQTVALILNFKRGSWFCTLGIVAVFLAWRARLRVLLALGVAVLVVTALPPVWSRLATLRTELTTRSGGRLAMWTQVAPELHARHPMGIGFRALTSDMMQDAARARGVYVEPGRNHLHSNPVQVWVETGWLGLALYLSWMAWALRDGVRGAWMARGGPDAGVAVIWVSMLAALLLNGLIEYNVADGELVLAYGVAMGAMAAQTVKRRVPQSGL